MGVATQKFAGARISKSATAYAWAISSLVGVDLKMKSAASEALNVSKFFGPGLITLIIGCCILTNIVGVTALMVCFAI